MPPPLYNRQLLALNDTQLEEFVRQWVSCKQEYCEVERFTGTGDLGRDVVGFITKDRHEGPWHNYQCKQYGRTLGTATGLLEIGKILYYSLKGEFTRPTGFYFVAPNGVNRNLKKLISKPTELKEKLLEKWDDYCATGISDGATIPLDDDLRKWIEEWDFSLVRAISVDMMLSDPAALAPLYRWFGADPGPAPQGVTPPDVEAREMPYVQQLVDAYGERESLVYGHHNEVMQHAAHGLHFDMQRERFFDADAFIHFFRDNTSSDDISILRKDIRHGIFEIYSAVHSDALAKVDAVMSQASIISPSGVLGRHARVPVKQGICHHFANEGSVTWKKK